MNLATKHLMKTISKHDKLINNITKVQNDKRHLVLVIIENSHKTQYRLQQKLGPLQPLISSITYIYL